MRNTLTYLLIYWTRVRHTGRDMSETQATRVQHKCNMTATQVWHECYTSDTSATRVSRGCYTNNTSAKRVKFFEFYSDTSKNMFLHPYIYYMANERLQGDEQFHSKNYLLEVPCFHAKMHLKSVPQN